MVRSTKEENKAEQEDRKRQERGFNILDRECDIHWEGDLSKHLQEVKEWMIWISGGGTLQEEARAWAQVLRVEQPWLVWRHQGG